MVGGEVGGVRELEVLVEIEEPFLLDLFLDTERGYVRRPPVIFISFQPGDPGAGRGQLDQPEEETPEVPGLHQAGLHHHPHPHT